MASWYIYIMAIDANRQNGIIVWGPLILTFVIHPTLKVHIHFGTETDKLAEVTDISSTHICKAVWNIQSSTAYQLYDNSHVYGWIHKYWCFTCYFHLLVFKLSQKIAHTLDYINPFTSHLLYYIVSMQWLHAANSYWL